MLWYIMTMGNDYVKLFEYDLITWKINALKAEWIFIQHIFILYDFYSENVQDIALHTLKRQTCIKLLWPRESRSAIYFNCLQ